MMYIYLFIALILVLLLGLVVVDFMDKKRGLATLERLALGFLLGVGLLTLILFWSSFVYIPYRVYIVGAIIAILFIFRRPKLQVNYRDLYNKKQLLWVLIFLVILIKLTYSFVETASKPEYTWDACVHWTYPGNIIYQLDQDKYSGIPNILNKFPGHIAHYPKQLPYMHYWLFSWMGEVNDQWSNIYLPISLVCFLVLFYFNLKRGRGSLMAIFFTWVLLSAPMFLYHTTFGYADFSIGIYFSTGIIFFYRWVCEKDELYFWIFAIFIALTSWIKFEGKPMIVLGLLLLLSYLWLNKKPIKNQLVRVGQYLLCYGLIGLPWQLLLHFNSVPSDERFRLHLNFVGNIHADLYNKLFIDGSWGATWFLAFFVMANFYKQFFKEENKYLLFAIFLFYFAIVSVYLVTDSYYNFGGAAFNRTLLIIYPVVIFTLGRICHFDLTK